MVALGQGCKKICAEKCWPIWGKKKSEVRYRQGAKVTVVESRRAEFLL